MQSVPEFSVAIEWFGFRKFNNFRIFWELSQGIFVPFVPLSKALELLVELKEPTYSRTAMFQNSVAGQLVIKLQWKYWPQLMFVLIQNMKMNLDIEIVFWESSEDIYLGAFTWYLRQALTSSSTGDISWWNNVNKYGPARGNHYDLIGMSYT